MVEEDPLHPEKYLAEIAHVRPQTLAGWRCEGRGPRFVKVGRRVFYRESAIREWLKSQERDPIRASAKRA